MEDIIKKSLLYSFLIKLLFLLCITFAACFFHEMKILIWYLVTPFVNMGLKISPIVVDEDELDETCQSR